MNLLGALGMVFAIILIIFGILIFLRYRNLKATGGGGGGGLLGFLAGCKGQIQRIREIFKDC